MTANERIAAHLYSFRYAYLGVVALVSALLLWPASHVGVDNSLEVWFPDDDPVYQEYLHFQNAFGNDEIVAIAIHDESGFLSESGLRHLTEVANRLQAIDSVVRVTSIASFQQAWAEGLGGRYTRMSQHPVAKSRLISGDEKTALLIAQLKSFGNMDSLRPKILGEIRDTLNQEKSFQLAGIGVIYDALNQLAIRDSMIFFVAGYVIIVLFLWLFMRNVVTVAATLTAAALSSLLLMGVYGLAGREINMVTMIMPSLLLVICISTCIHIYHHIRTMPAEGNERQTVITGLGAMIVPCFFNIATSGAGFLSLGASPMKVVRDLGLFTAFGLLAVFAVSLVLCVVAVANQRRTFVENRSRSTVIAKTVETVTTFAMDHPRSIIAASVILCVFAIIGMSRIVVDTNSIAFIADDHPVSKDSRLIESTIGPYTPLEFIVSGKTVLQRDTIRALQKWESAAKESGLVGWTHSLGSYIGRFPVEPALETLRDFPAVDGLWRQLVHEPDDIRVTFGIPIQSAAEIKHTIDTLMSLANFPGEVSVRPSGYLPLYSRMMSLIVDTLLYSFAIAFVSIFLVMALLFRSAGTLLLSIPSNLLPVLLVLGVMGWAGIPLDIATVTIASIALGLVVDDTVQFLYRYRALRKHNSAREAVRLTGHSVGQSMFMTTIAISLGLSVLMLANVKSVVWFGLLIPCTMGFALLADLLVLPALIMLFEKRAPKLS